MDLKMYFICALIIAFSSGVYFLSSLFTPVLGFSKTLDKTRKYDWLLNTVVVLLAVFLIPLYGKRPSVQMTVLFGLMAWQNYASAWARTILGKEKYIETIKAFYATESSGRFSAFVFLKFLLMFMLSIPLFVATIGKEPELWYIEGIGLGLATFAFYMAFIDIYQRRRCKRMAKNEAEAEKQAEAVPSANA